MRQTKAVLNVELGDATTTNPPASGLDRFGAPPASGVWSKVDGRPVPMKSQKAQAGNEACDHDEASLSEIEAAFARGDAVRRGLVVADENERTRLINDISRLIREPQMPEGTRAAGLTLIGWLARRMPGEQPHALGVSEARESERRLKATRKATR